ncbi:DNA methyltransferase [Micromonospora tulbaghiae]|uniref:DNA methyltransferase n=1 Tax=Micromonospora tulbaghiae TaxID=479978 RepID=UPI002448389F|nr:DNA methyltransferase [Micromonospora tulbaghiae]
MAPEIALDECSQLEPGSIVVDPMVGSGTTVHAAARAGCQAIGTDVDPLAVLMTQVRTTPLSTSTLVSLADSLSSKARAFTSSTRLGWIDSDPETKRFVDYWFAERQQHLLRALTILISDVSDSSLRAALKIAFSRLIVTKNKGASLGRDVSHSRPHKVLDENDFDVARQFFLASSRLAKVLEQATPMGRVTTLRSDARNTGLKSGIADLLITSPPYLNAIDYLRGHRLSLVWFGYSVAQIRHIRSESVGAERGISTLGTVRLEEMRTALGSYDSLAARFQRIVDRYLLDLHALYAEQARLLRRGSRAVTVIGNSALRGAFLQNDAAARVAAQAHGLILEDQYERTLPADRRYLPPPQHLGGAALQQRMRTETVLRFIKT